MSHPLIDQHGLVAGKKTLQNAAVVQKGVKDAAEPFKRASKESKSHQLSFRSS